MSGSNGGFFDTLGAALSNPAFQGLLGLTQGFGAAAMPQPYKGGTPFGAALGMGLGGLSQGVNNAYKTQLEQQQAQGLQISNKAAASQLPLTLARNKSLTDIWSNPDTLRTMLKAAGYGSDSVSPAQGPTLPVQRPTAAAGGVAQGQTQGAAQNWSGTPALSSISDPNARTAAVNAALKSGLPPAAWGPWIAAVHNESGWNLGEKDGSSGEIGPGQVMPETGKGLGYTPEQLRDPQTNLLASAQYFGQKWKEANGDPAGAFAGYNTGSVKGDAPQYVALAKARLGQWGGDPGASGTPAQQDASAITPGNASLLAQQYEARANQLEGQINAAKGLQAIGYPAMLPAGDPATLRKAAADYRAVALAGPTAAAKANVDIASAGPIQAAKSANEIQTDRYGNRYMGTTYLGRGPEVKEVYNTQTGNFDYQDVGAIGPDRKPIGVDANGMPAKLGPAEQERQQEVQKVQADQLKKDGAVVDDSLAHVIDNVTPAKQQLFQLRQLAQNPDTASGAAGQLRSQFKNWVQTFAPDFVSSVTGDATPSQEFNKIALMGAGKQERGDLGARGGFKAMEMYLHANPNLDMQPQANHDMANALLISHQFHADYAQGATNFYQQNYDKYVDPKNREPYQRLSKYDQAFNSTMKPELYAASINAINGKPYDEWAKGLNGDQIKIVGGILQRTDPSAAIDIKGQMVPVSKFTSVIGPSDIGPGAQGGR